MKALDIVMSGIEGVEKSDNKRVVPDAIRVFLRQQNGGRSVSIFVLKGDHGYGVVSLNTLVMLVAGRDLPPTLVYVAYDAIDGKFLSYMENGGAPKMLSEDHIEVLEAALSRLKPD